MYPSYRITMPRIDYPDGLTFDRYGNSYNNNTIIVKEEEEEEVVLEQSKEIQQENRDHSWLAVQFIRLVSKFFEGLKLFSIRFNI